MVSHRSQILHINFFVLDICWKIFPCIFPFKVIHNRLQGAFTFNIYTILWLVTVCRMVFFFFAPAISFDINLNACGSECVFFVCHIYDIRLVGHIGPLKLYSELNTKRMCTVITFLLPFVGLHYFTNAMYNVHSWIANCEFRKT